MLFSKTLESKSPGAGPGICVFKNKEEKKNFTDDSDEYQWLKTTVLN